MAKRFIDTNLFKSARVKALPPELKLFYVYLFCEADHTGVWRVELDVAALRIGMALPPEGRILEHLRGVIVPFDGGSKWFLPTFIQFQYGELNPANRVHRSILDTLERHGLTLSPDPANTPETPTPDPDTTTQAPPKPLRSPSKRAKDKDKETDMDKDPEPDKDGHGAIIRAYVDFMRARDLPARITAADGTAVKSIRAYLTKVDTVAAGTKTALDVWKFILDNWDRLGTWQRSQVQLRQINSQLPTIIETIKQSYGKQKHPNSGPSSVAGLAAAIRSGLEQGT